jgi:F-type H+-transporting ATPase subunit c
MEAEAAKLIGAGLAAIGAGLAAGGVGNVFGSFLQGALRNRLFIGFAAAELLGLLAFVVAMILIFVA